MHLTKSTLAAAVVATPLVVAQTYTDCNPLEKACPNDLGFEGTNFASDFTTGSGANASWSAAAYTNIDYGKNGAAFTIAKQGQAPTLQTDFYIFFGKVEVVMQAAAGTGIVSSIVLESEDLDEIDWEFLGGDTVQVQTNYFGKGNTTTYDRAIYYPVASPQTIFHTYTVDWTPERITFAVDGTVLRTLNYADANGGSNYPQTPMRLKLGNWAGGAPGNAPGTIQWAGGETDFSAAPFTMYVKSVKVTNYNPAQEYKWTDKTGSYKSIKVVKGDGTLASAAASSGTTSVSNARAAIKSHNIKQVLHMTAAVSSTSRGAALTTTVESMVSSSLPTAIAFRNGTAGSTGARLRNGTAPIRSTGARLGNGSAGPTGVRSLNGTAGSTGIRSMNGTAPIRSSTPLPSSTRSGSSVGGGSTSGNSTKSSSTRSSSTRSSSTQSSSTQSSLASQQTGNAASSNGVATAFVIAGSAVLAFMMA